MQPTLRFIRNHIKLVLLFTFCCYAASAQEYVVRQKAFNLAGQLSASDSYIRNVVTANNGFTYAITSQGIYRYNGATFEQQSLSVKGSIVEAIITENDQLILLIQNATKRSAINYDLNTRSIVPFKANLDTLVKAEGLIQVSNDINGNLWLTYDATTEERKARKLIIRYKNGSQDSVFTDAISTDFFLDEPNTWIRVDDHTYLQYNDQLKPTGKSITTYSGDVFLAPPGGQFSPLTTYQGKLTDAISGKRIEQKEWKPFSAPNNTIWWKHETKLDLYKITDTAGKLLVEFSIPESGVPDLSAQQYILDRKTNRIWFVTGTGKLYAIELIKVPFKKTLHNFYPKNGFLGAKGLWSNDTTLLIGGSIRSFIFDYLNDTILGEYDEIISFTEMIDGTIYGTDEGLDFGPADGLDIFAIRPKDNRVEQLIDNTETDDLKLYLGWAIVHVGDKLILGSVGGLSVYDFKSKQHQYIEQTEEFSDFSNYEVFQILKKEDQLMVLTDHGVYGANLDGIVIKKFKDFGPNDKRSTPIIHDAIKLDNDNYLLATAEKGLLFFSESKGVYDSLNSSDGLSSNKLFGLLIDQDSNIWASTDNGLNRIEQGKKRIDVFREEHGISSNNFTLKSRFRSASGRLYFGGIDGVFSFDPSEFKGLYDEQAKPTIMAVSQILKGEVERMKVETTGNNTFSISPDHSSIFIAPAYLNDIMLESNDFMYRLPGPDREWKNVADGVINLPSLRYGDYMIEVRVKNRFGLWTDTTLLDLSVRKPYFLQPWFWLLILVLVVVAGYLIYRWRVQQYKVRSAELELEVESRTEQLKIQSQELKELNKTQIRFFTNISHELRTPLTLIYSPIKDVIQNINQYSPEEIIDTLNVIDYSSNSLKKLIDEILNISKLEKGELQLEVEQIPQHLFFENLFYNFRKLAETKQQKLIINNHLEKDVSMKIDISKVEKIIGNLIGNAIKFTPEKGEIIIQITKHQSVLQVQIEDSGPGIPEEIRSRVFERFFQGNTSKTNEGFGIGLSMANDLCQLMGGKIELESSDGEGTKFTVELPVVFSNYEPSYEEEPIENDGHKLSAKRSTILLVEDNPELLRFIAKLLSKKHQIITAQDGEVAWQILQDDFKNKHDIKMVISDIMMPNLDGYGLLELVRSNHGIKAVSFLFLSALNSKQNVIKGFATGVDSYITKPFQPKELFVVVDGLLNRYEDRREYQMSFKETENKTPPLDLISGENWSWLNKVEAMIKEKASDQTFKIEDLASNLNISYRQLNRKIKSLTGMSPIQYQREVKLLMANEKLESTNKSLKELAVELGFSRASYLGKLYKERFPE